MRERKQFIDVWGREFPTTVNVLKSYPADHADFTPARAQT